VPPYVHRLENPEKNHNDEPDEKKNLRDDGKEHCDISPDHQLDSSTRWLWREKQQRT